MMLKGFFQGKVQEYQRRTGLITKKNDKGFGIVMGVAFALFALWAFAAESGNMYWFLGFSGAFLLLAFTIPQLMRPLHKVWLGLGLFLETFLSPLIMLAVYAVGFVPFAVLYRLAGRDVLQLKKDTTKESYWCKRDFNPTADDFKQQF